MSTLLVEINCHITHLRGGIVVANVILTDSIEGSHLRATAMAPFSSGTAMTLPWHCIALSACYRPACSTAIHHCQERCHVRTTVPQRGQGTRLHIVHMLFMGLGFRVTCCAQIYNQSGEDGAISTLRAATDPSLTGQGFKYFGPWYKGPLIIHTGNDSKYRASSSCCVCPSFYSPLCYVSPFVIDLCLLNFCFVAMMLSVCHNLLGFQPNCDVQSSC